MELILLDLLPGVGVGYLDLQGRKGIKLPSEPEMHFLFKCSPDPIGNLVRVLRGGHRLLRFGFGR